MEDKKNASLIKTKKTPLEIIFAFFIKFSIFIYRFIRSFFVGIVCLFYPIIYLVKEHDKKPLTEEQQKKLALKTQHKEELKQKKIEELEKKRALVNKKREEQRLNALAEKEKREELKKEKLKELELRKNEGAEERKLRKAKEKEEREKRREEAILQKEEAVREKKLAIAKEKEAKRQRKIANKNKSKDQIKEEVALEKEKLRQEKAQLKEEKRLQKLENYKQKKIEKQKAIEAKDRKKEEEQLAKIKKEKERRKRLSERYESEDYQKTSFLTNFGKNLKATPKNIKEALIKRYNNLTIVKNIRNKRDINRQALLISFEGDDAKKSDEKLTYQYVAKDPNGKIVRDYFDAYSKVEVHSFLLSEGYEVYSIKTSSFIQFLNGSVIKTKVKTKDLIFILTQLSTYIKSGISLVDSLKILSKQYKKRSYQKIFRTIIYDLTMGDSFSQALEKQEQAFPKLLINMVKAAEMTGDLAETLDDMANYYTETEKTRKQMITALLYPTIILIVAIAVLSFIMIYIIPRFVSIYESMDASQIPTITLVVLSFSDFMQKYYLYLFAGFVAFIIIMRLLYMHVKFIRTCLQWIAMHLPVFGNIIIYNEVTMFTKTFSSLLRHNVFITDSMEILNKITNNEIYKMLILDTITNLARGDKISLAFQGHWAFPIPAYEMIVTGEKTGQLAEMMAKVSDYYQELHKNLVLRMKTFIEPVLIVFLTIIVGIIILSIVVPMFNMYSVIQMQ